MGGGCGISRTAYLPRKQEVCRCTYTPVPVQRYDVSVCMVLTPAYARLRLCLHRDLYLRTSSFFPPCLGPHVERVALWDHARPCLICLLVSSCLPFPFRFLLTIILVDSMQTFLLQHRIEKLDFLVLSPRSDSD